MAQSLADIILHIVFSTKSRQPMIQAEIESELYPYLNTICQNLNSPMIRINGVSDHVHILLSLGRTISVSKLIEELKSQSSRWIKTKGPQYRDFAWQNGYGGFSVSRTNVEGVIKYVTNQKEHHKKIGFKEEFLAMLDRAGIEYDERYLWD
jgi:putative transposase